MGKICKILFCLVFFAALALPPMRFLGLTHEFTKLHGHEVPVELPALSVASLRDRTFQDAATALFARRFFLRDVCVKTAYQIREATNFGKFHYGFRATLMDGRDGVLFERPYLQFHKTCPRPGGRAKYAKALETLREIDAFCASNGAHFVAMLFPDKPQAYPEYLPGWLGWLCDYSNYDTQGEIAGLLREDGIDVFDANRYLLGRKSEWTAWVYPPAGTHFSAYGCGLFYNGFLEEFVDTGRYAFRGARFVKALPRKTAWYLDDDIGNALNIWRNTHVARNVYTEPVFEPADAVPNEGSMVVFGDCYCDQVARIFGDARFFDRKRIHKAKRYGKEKPEDLAPFVRDLKLLVLSFQSFNTGRLDERHDEIAAIYKALREARSSLEFTHF